MARRTTTYAIRLAVEGGGQVKAELVSVGQSGEQSLKRIETRASRAAAHRDSYARRALVGGTTVGGLAALVDRSISAADAIGKTAGKIGVASRRCRSCALLRRRPASSSRRSTWRCRASPAARPRRRRARARPRTLLPRWASRRAT